MGFESIMPSKGTIFGGPADSGTFPFYTFKLSRKTRESDFFKLFFDFTGISSIMEYEDKEMQGDAGARYISTVFARITPDGRQPKPSIIDREVKKRVEETPKLGQGFSGYLLDYTPNFDSQNVKGMYEKLAKQANKYPALYH